ncbi:MAG: FKBP-type peptidyl-prolyl cis-trans isomerase [Chitinophagaceae bacterium]|nr:FKBP-type peptidyl-prolyl cis-trans isomerase [Chitinophagaceae bacterium]
MKKTATIILGLALVFAFGGCSNGGFKKTKSGILYKIISDGKAPLAKKGEFLKVDYTQRIKGAGRDTILQTSVGSLPTYAPVDSLGPVYNPAEVFNKLRRGDSAIIVMLADSLIKKSGQLPPFIHKKDKLELTLKVVDVFKNEEDLRKDQQALLDRKKQTEIKQIEQYLASKGIKAQKTEKGVFVEIEKKGDGPAVDSGKAAHVKYKGQTFAGKVFDSNMDSAFGHADPYVLTIGKHGAIEGWDDGLRLFNKGGKGRLYIPSMMAYGPNPPQGAPFKPFENLMFDIEVIDVTDAKDLPAPVMPSQMPHQMPGGHPMPPEPRK